MNAGAKDCEILIAVTKSDETNMIACQIGHSLFKIPKKIARIRQQDYLKRRMAKIIYEKRSCQLMLLFLLSKK